MAGDDGGEVVGDGACEESGLGKRAVLVYMCIWSLKIGEFVGVERERERERGESKG